MGIVPLTAALLMAGCSADSQLEQGQTDDDLRAIRLTATVSAGLHADTRAATGIQSEQFEEGQTFYAYFPSGVSVGNVTSASSTTFTTTNTSGATTPATQPYFNAGTSSVRVHAYYGKSGYVSAESQGSQVTNGTGSFTVALDQTGDNNDATSDLGYMASDLMYATTTVAVDKSIQASATGNLTFTHKMSKIIVRANLGAGINSVTDVRIIGGSKTVAIANATTTDESSSSYLGTASTATADQLSDADGKRIILYSGSHTDRNAALECAALIPPQTVPASGTAETPFLWVNTDQGAVTYSLTGKRFDSGQSYTFAITVSLADIGHSVTIRDWNDNGSVTVNPITGGGAPELSPTALNLTYKGGNQTVTATLDGASVFSAISSNTGIARVSASGSTITVNPVAPGECTVNVFPTDASSSFSSAICNVTVAKAPATISFATSSYRKEVDDISLTQTVTNTYDVDGAAGDGSVTYSVTNSGGSTATVNSTTGEVTLGGNAGTVTVTATVTDGTYCTYAVKSVSYTIVIAPKTNANVADPTVGDWDSGGTVDDGLTPDRKL